MILYAAIVVAGIAVLYGAIRLLRSVRNYESAVRAHYERMQSDGRR